MGYQQGQHDALLAVAVILLMLIAYGVAGGIEQGTIALPF